MLKDMYIMLSSMMWPFVALPVVLMASMGGESKAQLPLEISQCEENLFISGDEGFVELTAGKEIALQQYDWKESVSWVWDFWADPKRAREREIMYAYEASKIPSDRLMVLGELASKSDRRLGLAVGPLIEKSDVFSQSNIELEVKPVSWKWVPYSEGVDIKAGNLPSIFIDKAYYDYFGKRLNEGNLTKYILTNEEIPGVEPVPIKFIARDRSRCARS